MAHTFARPNTAARFELKVDCHTAFANYRNIDGVIAITHIDVLRALRELGIGSRLALDMPLAVAFLHVLNDDLMKARSSSRPALCSVSMGRRI